MGLYDRDYYRELNSPLRGPGGLTPVIKYLIAANVAVFLAQLLVVREAGSPLARLRHELPEFDPLLASDPDGREALDRLRTEDPERYELLTDPARDSPFGPGQRLSVVQAWLELDTHRVVRGGQVWRLLTYAFCHDRYGVWHLVVNLVLLYWFGTSLEVLYGSREFLLFYLAAALASALAFVGLDLYTGSAAPAVGASGAVAAVLMLYTVHFPRETICVCWLFPLEMRWLMALYLVWDLHPVLLALSGDRQWTGLAHAAHLGGLAFGFLYGRYQWRLEPLAAAGAAGRGTAPVRRRPARRRMPRRSGWTRCCGRSPRRARPA